MKLILRTILALLCMVILNACGLLDGGTPIQETVTTVNGQPAVIRTPVQDPDKAAFNQLCREVVK